MVHIASALHARPPRIPRQSDQLPIGKQDSTEQRYSGGLQHCLLFSTILKHRFPTLCGSQGPLQSDQSSLGEGPGQVQGQHSWVCLCRLSRGGAFRLLQDRHVQALRSHTTQPAQPRGAALDLVKAIVTQLWGASSAFILPFFPIPHFYST